MEKLRQYMEVSKLNQGDVAMILGISISNYSEKEGGEVPLKEAKKLAIYLELLSKNFFRESFSF